MSSNRTEALAIASRYSTAIFALALDAKKEDVVVDEIGTIGRAITENKDLAAAFANPLIHRTEKAAILADLAKKADALTKRALAEIGREGRADILPVIAESLQAKLTAQRGELEAIVTSARPLSDAMKKQLSASLTSATGKEVQLQLKQDPSVLGGVSIQLGSLRLDATLAGALNTMRAHLIAQANQSL